MLRTTTNLKGLAEGLGITDKGFIDFCTSLKNGDITLKEGQTYLQAYQEQLNSLGFSFSKVKSMATIREQAGHEDEQTSLNNYCFDQNTDRVIEDKLEHAANQNVCI